MINYNYFSNLQKLLTPELTDTAFFGYIIGLLALGLGMWMLMPLGVVSYLIFPAAILIIIHGAKFKDKYFVLADIFYFISLLSIFVYLLPIPTILIDIL